MVIMTVNRLLGRKEDEDMDFITYVSGRKGLLIKERYPNAQVYNLDIVKPGTPNPVVKDYKPALRDGQKLQSAFIEYDIRKPIENLPFTPTEDDVIFNFAAEELKKVTGLT